jgi:hypothetical protein
VLHCVPCSCRFYVPRLWIDLVSVIPWWRMSRWGHLLRMLRVYKLTIVSRMLSTGSRLWSHS